MNLHRETQAVHSYLEELPETRRETNPVQLGPYRWSDPYRWLEGDSEEVSTWSLAQDVRALQALHSQPHYETLRSRFEALLAGERAGKVAQAGKRFFFRTRQAGAELWSLWVSDSIDGTKRLLIDPSTMFGESQPKLAGTYPSPQGRFVAFQLSHEGSSLMPLQVMEVDSGRVLDDFVPADLNPVARLWHSENRVTWTADESGYYYSRCPEEVSPDETRYHQKIYFHRLGEDFVQDELVFGHELPREKSVIPYLSEGDRYLVISVHDHSGSTPSSEVFAREVNKSSQTFRQCLSGAPGVVDLHLKGQVVFVKANRSESHASIARFSLDDMDTEPCRLETVIPSNARNLGAWGVSENAIIVETQENELPCLSIYNHDGDLKQVVELEPFASIGWITTATHGSLVYFSMSSPLSSPKVSRLDLATMECATGNESDRGLGSEDYEIQTVWFSSRDGTQVRMHLVHRRGLKRNGKNPTVLRAYGGFGVSLTPKFRADVMPLLEQGGVYAEANVRGGGEFGQSWHRAGSRENKQNSFDDLIAAGEFLVDEGYTSKEHLGCLGWSNGGLLTTVAAVQRPDLWRAVVAGAPITDMTRFHLTHGARHWISEFGSPENEDELGVLLSYSPYHNVPDEIVAPAILIYAPDADDRVAAWHGRKQLAQWQAASTSARPILLRSPLHTGHQANSNLTTTVTRYTDIMAFFFWQLGIPSPLRGKDSANV